MTIKVELITQAELDKVAAAVKGATSGRWEVTYDEERSDAYLLVCANGHVLIRDDEASLADLQAVVALRNAAPALLAEITALRAEIVVAREALEALSDGACNSKYGPGCDTQCKYVAYGALAKLDARKSREGQ